MRKLLSFLPFVLLVVVFASCDESKETTKYHNWRERNEAFIDSLRNVFDSDPDLDRLLDQRNKDNYIYYKKIKTNDTGEIPYFTSNVTTYYRAMLIDEGVLYRADSKYYSDLYKNLEVISSNYKGDQPNEFDTPTTSAVQNFYIYGTGCMEILQHMRIGEKWELYIPWSSAYGSYWASSSSTTASINGYLSLFMGVPAYSALIVNIELLNVENPTE